MVKQSNYNINVNVLLIILILTSLFINGWLWLKDVKIGLTYFVIIAIGLLSIFILMFFTKGEPEFLWVGKILKAPFELNLGVAMIFYILGIIAPFIINLVIKVFTSFSLTSFSIPLYGGQLLSGLTQSFSIAQIESSMSWKIFNMWFNSGVSEELVFSFLTMFIFTAVLALIFMKKERILGIGKGNFILVTSILISCALFTYLHNLNSSYVGWMFLWAFVFKLLSLVSIYYFKIGLIFWFGFHGSNNFIYLIEQEGGINVLNGLLSWVGVLMIGLLFIIIPYYLATHWNDTMRAFKEERK